MTRVRQFTLGFVLLLATGFLTRAASLVVVPTPGDGQVPDAEVDAAGVLHVAFVRDEDVYYAKSANHGQSFTAPLRVNSEPGTAHPANLFRGPDLALGAAGQVHVVWYANAYQRKLPKDQWGVRYAHLNRDRSAFVPTRNLNHTPSDNYSLAADAAGRVAVFWMAEGLFLHASNDDGETFADARRLTEADACECCASRALFTGDGALHCAYRDKAANVRDMFLLTQPRGETSFRRDKISVTSWPINACPMTGTFLANTKGGLAMAWETQGQVYFTRWTGRGAVREIAATARGKWPVALVAPDGTLLLSWKQGSTLQWQRYDADNQPVGEVNSAPSRGPHRHAGVVTAAGDFRLID